MTELRITGDWNDIKYKLQKQFSELTDYDLFYTEGHEEELIDRLQNKLRWGKEEIIDVIHKIQLNEETDYTQGSPKDQ